LIQVANAASTPSTPAILRELTARLPLLRPVDAGGAPLEVAFGSHEPPETRSAELLEDTVMRAHAVSPSATRTFAAFLDGAQESRIIAWAGGVPIVLATLGAVIRQRVNGRFSRWRMAHLSLRQCYAPWRQLAVDPATQGTVGLRDVSEDAGGGEVHPFRRIQLASNAVKQDRERLEAQLAGEYCRSDEDPLFVDGNLPASDEVRTSARVIGVVKSHHTLYATGRDLEAVFGLRDGERSSVFVIDSRRRPAVASWYLRLRHAEHRGPLWGLVRVEVPLPVFERGVGEEADRRSSWILAERSPVALPDSRWDTLVYGIQQCEEFLRAVR
jgi:hypothetical protein